MSELNKNKDTVSQIFFTLRSSLMRAISTIVPPKDIEDIVQETYVRVCQVENQSEIRCQRSFMLKIARNLAFDYVKRAENRLVTSIDNLDHLEYQEAFTSGTDEIYEQVASHKEFSYFCEAVRNLPLQCRRVFVLKKVYGYSQKEIADHLKLSESTVEKHVALGIKRCTQYMIALEK